MAGIGKLAKTAWKVISYLPEKAHALQTPFVALAGRQLTKGQKVANCILKPLNFTAKSLPLVGVAGIIGGTGTAAYGNATNDKDIELKGATIALKSAEAFFGTALGLVVGGPVGAIAGATYALLGDKSLVCSIAKLFDKEEGQAFENDINQQRQKMFESVKNFIGLSSTEQEAQPEEHEAVEEEEQVVEEQVEEEQVEEKPTEAEEEEQDQEVQEEQSQQPPQEEASEEEAAIEQQGQPQDPPPAQGNPPAANNLFGGEINGITTANHKIVKNDCLWNIAKKYLQDANPGKTITDAQILKQVKEFGRINPEMFGENPTPEKLDLIYPENNLKLCA